jgi:cyclase
MAHVIAKTASNVFMPLTVGGGIHSLEDARRIFNAGADKVSVNTAALKNSKLVNELARRFGSQACMVAIDAKRRYVRSEDAAREIIETKDGKCWFECSFYGGRKFTGVDAIKWAIFNFPYHPYSIPSSHSLLIHQNTSIELPSPLIPRL